MPGPNDDRQYPGPVKRIALPTLTGAKIGGGTGGIYGKDNPFMKVGGGQGANLATPQAIPPSQMGRTQTFNGGVAGAQVGGGAPFAGSAPNPASGPGGMSFNNLFSLKNPFLQNMGGALGAGMRMGTGGQLPFGGSAGGSIGAGGGAGANAGMHPEEAKWAGIAQKYGVDWNVTKAVYMRSPRNPNFSPARAIDLQLDDKAWGDAALAAGILRPGGTPENDAWNNQVWVDHYNANGNMAADPMAGHNYAISAYEANQQAIANQVNGVPQMPEWMQ